MNQIQKSFLTTDEKIIPFNPTKANYGFSSVDGKDLDRITALLNVNKNKNLYIQNLPASVPFVVILMRIPNGDEIEFLNPDETVDEIKQQNLKVTDVQTAPPGVSTVSFTLDPNEQYYLYVLSSQYNDGYIAQGNLSGATLISETVDHNERYLFSIDSDAKVFVQEIAFQPSNMKNTSEQNVWYDFQDEYKKPILIWEDPQPWLTYGANRPRGNQSWLVYMRNLYSEMQAAIFKGFDLEGHGGKALFDTQVYGRLVDNEDGMLLSDIIKGYFGRDFAVRTWDKWTEYEEMFVSGDDDVREAYYNRARWSTLDNSPKYRVPGDPVQQYQEVQTKGEIRGALGVIYMYVFKAYNKRVGRSAWSDFSPPFRSSSSTFGSRNRYDDLARAVSNEIEGVTELELETSHPVIGDEAREIFTRLEQFGTDDHDGVALLNYVYNKLVSYNVTDPQKYIPWEAWFFPRTNSVISYNDEEQFDRGIVRSAMAGNSTYDFLTTYYKDRVTDGLAELDARIIELGDGVLIPPPEDEGDLPELAHEATLQNIRFLRGILDAYVKDSWTESTNFSSFILKKIDELRNEVLTLTARANTLFSITDARINDNTVEVLWKEYGANEWDTLAAGVTDQGNGIKTVDLSEISVAGKYLVIIRPRGLTIRIDTIKSDALLTSQDLDNFRAQNYFFGWNIEFTNPGTTQIPIGEQRMIVGSKFQIGAHELLVSPNIYGVQDFAEQVWAYIWPNSFIPVMVDLEVTDHNIQTLAFDAYGHREFNTDSGVLTIYDFNDRPFKRFTVGERTKADENYDTIEFRDPVD